MIINNIYCNNYDPAFLEYSIFLAWKINVTRYSLAIERFSSHEREKTIYANCFISYTLQEKNNRASGTKIKTAADIICSL